MAEALWDDVAEVYDRSFATLCAGTTQTLLAALPPAGRVLDVGCGSGHVTAAFVAAGHVVQAVDPDPQMVALTAARTSVGVHLGALPDLPFEEWSFDAVVANFVLNHVDHPRAAARGLARVARPGGIVMATIWPGYVPPQLVLWNAVIDAAGAVRPDMPRLAPELDYERSTDGLADLLAGVGLAVADATMTEWDWRVRPADFLAGVAKVGNFGVVWRAQSPDVHERMHEAFDEAAAPWRDGDELVFPVRAVVVRAVS